MTKTIDIADVRARLAAPILGRAQPDPFDLTVHHRHPRIATIRFVPGRPIGYALSASYPDWTDRSFLAQRLAGMRLFFGALRDIEPGLDGTCDLWLGDVPEAPGLAFSGCASSNVLVPDPDFVASDGYRQLRREAEGMLPWPERENDLFWRGTLSGDPKRRAPGWRTLQRARLCLAGRASVVGVPLDAKLVGDPRNAAGSEGWVEIGDLGLLADRVALHDFARYRHAIDIDGNSCAWMGLFTKLLMGCTVVKVDSPLGHRQWYYDRLVPWIDFVPVSADLGDLDAVRTWLAREPEAARAIAARGRALACAITFDQALLDVAPRVIAHIRAAKAQPCA